MTHLTTDQMVIGRSICPRGYPWDDLAPRRRCGYRYQQLRSLKALGGLSGRTLLVNDWNFLESTKRGSYATARLVW